MYVEVTNVCLPQMPGHGRGGWGRWGLRCRERDREGALLHGVGPLHGVNEDTAVTPTGRRGGRQRGSCTGKEGSCVRVCT